MFLWQNVVASPDSGFGNGSGEVMGCELPSRHTAAGLISRLMSCKRVCHAGSKRESDPNPPGKGGGKTPFFLPRPASQWLTADCVCASLSERPAFSPSPKAAVHDRAERTRICLCTSSSSISTSSTSSTVMSAPKPGVSAPNSPSRLMAAAGV